MARVVIVGSHGKVALQLSAILTQRGDAVTSLFRNPDHADDVAATGAKPVVADIERLDTDALAGAGHDAVARTYAVDRDAAIRVVDAAARSGVKRFVMVSYFGAGPDHGVPQDDPFFPYAESKAAADAHLRVSDLDWTILGPGRLTLDPPTGRTSQASPPPPSPTTRRSGAPSTSTTVTCRSPSHWPAEPARRRGKLRYAAGLLASQPRREHRAKQR